MKIKVVTICGGLKFQKEMQSISRDLTLNNGWCVIQCVYEIDKTKITQLEIDNMVKAHYKKIEISDAIYVVNINGYIGNSTKNEIEYAKSLNKEIIYHEER
ncbi:MAG: hypothetical protein E7374_03410 [Clostridiales bacterium]|nr:hypothetical protein [Clostridiales bacterium]